MNLMYFNGNVLDTKPEVTRVNEHGALMYAGRWGIHGVSLPGRATFSPGNVGWVTFGAPRPQQVHYHLFYVLCYFTNEGLLLYLTNTNHFNLFPAVESSQ